MIKDLKNHVNKIKRKWNIFLKELNGTLEIQWIGSIAGWKLQKRKISELEDIAI